jgi:hypothetical protein
MTTKNQIKGRITGGYKIKKPQKPLEYCSKCRHLKTEFITKRVCKQNCVGREEHDTCCWTGKRYPSRYSPKEVLTSPDFLTKYNEDSIECMKQKVGIHCPKCGWHQVVPIDMWAFQSTMGHGYTCGSGKCPSHTYMVLDDVVTPQIFQDFMKECERDLSIIEGEMVGCYHGTNCFLHAARAREDMEARIKRFRLLIGEKVVL